MNGTRHGYDKMERGMVLLQWDHKATSASDVVS